MKTIYLIIEIFCVATMFAVVYKQPSPLTVGALAFCICNFIIALEEIYKR